MPATSVINSPSLPGDPTFWVSATGAAAAVVAAVLGGFNAHRSRVWIGREQWWARFTWACEKAVSTTAQESEVGLSTLRALITVPWALTEDDELVIAVSTLIGETSSQHPRLSAARPLKRTTNARRR
ncbi:hypothetical protein [Okibacterium fritillariae]|uniref:hypothetical protein n=1 Tax=Okibacterium fritillariae TaxID=123320 RepID=UPI00117E3A89|nr:hypothetical protein [Okibacterium fritillariae]